MWSAPRLFARQLRGFTLTLKGRTSGRSLGTFLQSMLFLPPHNKMSLISPHPFLTFTYSSTMFLSTSLSLSKRTSTTIAGLCFLCCEVRAEET
jgi:hypothetical protein